MDDEEQFRKITEHGRGSLSPREVQARISEIWRRRVETEAGRQQIAAWLDVSPSDILVGAAPLGLDEPKAGIVSPDLVIVAHWAAVNVVVPVLVGLGKDLAKERLLRLWRQLFVSELKSEDSTAIDRETLGA